MKQCVIESCNAVTRACNGLNVTGWQKRRFCNAVTRSLRSVTNVTNNAGKFDTLF